jgi:multicomponent Na+:H+ antiporter subunit G
MVIWNLFIEILTWICMLGGIFFVLVGSVGIIRFPDFWSRMHAASIMDSAGVILFIIGMMLYSGFNLISVKLVIIGVFLFITGPTATHAVANAAFISGSRPLGGGMKDTSEDSALVHKEEDQ